MIEINTYKIYLDEDKRPFLVAGEADFVENSIKLNCPAEAYRFACDFLKMDRMAEEHVYIIGMDVKCNPLGVSEVGHGTVDSCQASVRSIMTRLLLMGASKFLVIHNHPSGESEPSRDDYRFTEAVRAAGELMEIQLLDHIIVGRNGFSSFVRMQGGNDGEVK